MAHPCNPSFQESAPGESLQIKSQTQYSEFQAIWGYSFNSVTKKQHESVKFIP